MARRANHKSAFTLLEMLVALSIMALLAASLYASLRIGFDARARSEAAIAPVRSVALALDMLREDIESAPPPDGVLAGVFLGQDGKTDDTGDNADTLAFYTTAEDVAAANPGIRKIEIALAPPPSRGRQQGADYDLVRSVTSNLLAPTTPEPVEEALCRHVVSLNLRYFDGTVWLDTWDSTAHLNVLPIAVAATLQIRDPSRLPKAGGTGTGLYEVTRIFRLPCATPPRGGEQGAV